MIAAILNGFKYFLSLVSSGFHYIALGIGVVWSMFSYAMGYLSGLPSWISVFCIVCLIIAVIKLIVGR